MDALTLAHQIVELCKQSGLEADRAELALEIAGKLLADDLAAAYEEEFNRLDQPSAAP